MEKPQKTTIIANMDGTGDHEHDAFDGCPQTSLRRDGALGRGADEEDPLEWSRKVDWSSVDWSKSNVQLAEELRRKTTEADV